jgi:hypothetical protein
MGLRLWRFWGAFLLVTFLSCRSEKAAFNFQSTTTEISYAASIAVPADSVPVVATAPPRAGAAMRPGAPAFSVITSSKPAGVKPAIRQQTNQVSPAIFQLKNQQSAALAHQTTANLDRLHLLLGIGLIVGGVVAGILIGGWLGLGVGALIVLLGDYFLILGLGGKHAWLEIFQEFFNL